jgi:REP element-mobilizing transposase RayT
MSWPLRIEFEGAWYHVMNRGRAHEVILADETDYEALLAAAGEAMERFGAEVHAYCLMPNHYHLLVHTPRGNLGRVMRHIDGLYTQRYNRRHGIDGSLFRGRHRAILVDADSYLLSVFRYIHCNPIDGVKPLVENLEEWRWSSFPAFVRRLPPAEWLFIDPTLDMLGVRNRYAAYRRFVLAPVEKKVAEFYANPRATPILGNESFRERMLQDVSQSRENVRPHVRSLRTPDQVLAAVSAEFGMEPTVLLGRDARRRGSDAVARQIAMRVCRDRTGLTLREIGERFGKIHYSAVNQNIRRLSARLEDRPDLFDRYQAVLSRLDP